MANQPGSTAPRGTSEEIQLRGRARRRLVGAIALVALIVVILPMVLDEEPKPMGQDIAINIPSQQAPEPTVAPVGEAVVAARADDSQSAGSAPAAVKPTEPAAQPAEVAKAPAVQPAKPVEPAKIPANEAPAKSAKAAEVPKVSPTATPAKASKPADAPKAAAKEIPAKAAADKPKEEKAHSGDKADKGGFAVQLGVFASAANVKQLQAKLTGRGIHSYTESLKTESGSKIRLRAGPYASRQEAEKVRDKLKAAGENGIVVANK